MACREEQPPEKRETKDPDDPNNTCAPSSWHGRVVVARLPAAG